MSEDLVFKPCNASFEKEEDAQDEEAMCFT